MYKVINLNLEQVEADNGKIEAKINFRNHCVTHFKNLTNKIEKLLVKANKDNKTYIDLADIVKQEIVGNDTVFRQGIGALTQEEEAKVLKDTAVLAELLRDECSDLISLLSNQDKLRMVRSEGGNGFYCNTLAQRMGKSTIWV